MKVKDIMNQAIAVDFDISLKEASNIMARKKIGSLIVMKDSKIAGIITESDVTSNTPALSKKVSEIMSKNVVTIDEEEDIDNAASIMAKNKIKRVPVLSKDKKLAGIITATDLIAHSDELNEDFFLE